MFDGCLPVGGIKYIVELVDNTGEVVEQRVVTSDSCCNGTCSILILPSGTCLVKVQATSPFGNSSTEVINNGHGKIWPPTTFFPFLGHQFSQLSNHASASTLEFCTAFQVALG